MKTVYTCCVFSLVVLLMIGCAKEEQQKPSTTGTTYTNGGNNNNNSSNNSNTSTGKPINNNTTLPVNHPVGSAAACGGCHKGFLKVPDWVINDIAKEEEDMLNAATNTLQEQKSE
jgi:hypothetical protein